MGLPLHKLICASNENKVLANFLATGLYDKRRELVRTISPSMDILVSSNLERLLWDISEGKTEQVSELMKSLDKKGFYQITPDMKNKLEDFSGGFAREEEARYSIKEVFQESGYLIDPHTAVGYVVYKKYVNETQDQTKTVIIATASPFKFTTSVMESISKEYKKYDDFELIEKMANLSQLPIPPGMKDLKNKPILHNIICDKSEMKAKITEILSY
jgi:threonine synthase